jgi:hypothetical protein
LFALLADDLSDLLEENVEIHDTFFDVTDLLLSLSNEGILKVDLILGS